MNSTDRYLKKIIVPILLLALTVVCIFCIVLFFRVRNNQYPDLPERVEVDTVFVSRFFIPESNLKFREFPEVVYMFFSDSIPVKDIRVIRDTVFVETEDSTLNYNAQFLAQYPNASKLIQMELNRDLRFTLLHPSGKISQEVYQVDPEINRYLYTDCLTSQRKNFWQRLSPFVQLQIRPFNTMVDLDLGLKYKTSRMQYEIGINGFYYQPLPKPFGADLFLRARYEF